MTAAERWLPVTGYEGLYEVSDQGRVRSLERQTPAGLRGGRILKPQPSNATGHLAVQLSREGRVTNHRVHRLVGQAFIPNPHDYPLVRHLDGNPGDNRAERIAWGTTADNIADAQRHGTIPIGTSAAARQRNRRATDPVYAEASRAASRRSRARKKEALHDIA